LSRNLPRDSQTVGRVQRSYVDNWLRTSDSVRVFNLSGADLNKIVARLKRQTPGGSIAPASFVFAAGLDVASNRVRGRPVTSDQSYRVALTDAVMSLVSDVNFGAYTPDDRFTFREAGTFADDEGKPLLLRDLILRNVERKSAEANPIEQRVYLRQRLEDYSLVRDIKWTAALEELSIRGSRYVNNNAVGRLAGSLQTRLTTQDNTNFDLRTRLRGTFDGPTLAWDNRLRAELAQLVFDSDTGSDRQEPTDDIVLTTELRFNAVELELLALGFGVTPFVQAVGDTEFTPTQATDPNDSTRTIDNPRQALLRGLAGIVAQPSGTLREVRLGAVFEQDFSNDNSEIGFQASYELKWLILPELTWESTLEARYFFPSSQDDDTSLGLIVQAVNRFLVPVGGLFDVYGYVDFYAARGKTETTSQLGASWDIGAGIDVARLFASSRARSAPDNFFESFVE
ncbi:MAG: hypothetical protein AAF658_17060, partial [Myxococcota bacterium]